MLLASLKLSAKLSNWLRVEPFMLEGTLEEDFGPFLLHLGHLF